MDLPFMKPLWFFEMILGRILETLELRILDDFLRNVAEANGCEVWKALGIVYFGDHENASMCV